MILDTLDAIGKYAGISPSFETAVRWLQETDPDALEPGRTDIDGEKVYAVVSENLLDMIVYLEYGICAGYTGKCGADTS